jgi:hypothetical protein
MVEHCAYYHRDVAVCILDLNPIRSADIWVGGGSWGIEASLAWIYYLFCNLDSPAQHPHIWEVLGSE